MIEIAFRKPSIDDQELLEPYFKADPHAMSCEMTFANLFLWSGHYRGEFAVLDDMLVIRAGAGNNVSFAYPMGIHDPAPVVQKLMDYCAERGIPFRMHGVTNDKRADLEAAFPGKFDFIPDRDSADYIYLSEDLIHLKGKKYHGKRNHINRFKEENNWSYEPITRENMDDCMAFALEWCKQNGCDDDGRLAEVCVIRNAFRYFERLHLVGGALRIDRKMVAFTIGEPMNEDVFVVHIEKADASINGAYPTINQEFIAHEAGSYRYINREEDLGIEGLRKAKLSYRPVIILEEYQAVLREEDTVPQDTTAQA